MRIKVAGFGLDFHRSFRGYDLIIGSNIEWQWCLRLDYRTPWVLIDGEDMMGLPRDWHRSRYFYFGRTRTDRAPGFERYQQVSRAALTHGHGWGWS